MKTSLETLLNMPGVWKGMMVRRAENRRIGKISLYKIRCLYLNLLPHRRIKDNLFIVYSWKFYLIQIRQAYCNERVSMQTKKKGIKWKFIYWIMWNLSSAFSPWSHNTSCQAYIPFSSPLQLRYWMILFWRSRITSKNSHPIIYKGFIEKVCGYPIINPSQALLCIQSSQSSF